MEFARRKGRRGKKLLDDLKEERVRWKLREEVLDPASWRTRFERAYGLHLRHITERMSTDVFT